MKKRKVSIEKNPTYRETSARPSVASLRATNTYHHLRRSRSAKSPSVQNLHNSDSSDKPAKPGNDRIMLPDEMQPPKTRFTSRDKSKEARNSTSSPRLKSFPVEKIKKFNNSPLFTPEPIGALIMQQNPREAGTFFASSPAESNNGHGDAMFAQLSSVHQQLKQSTSGTSQQQIAANRQQICQASPHSESLLTRRIASPERQVHRPYVPNTFQAAVTRDRSPRNSPTIINQPVIIQTPPTQTAMPQTQQPLSDSHAVIDQDRNEAAALGGKCERQPVGGRNAANYGQTFAQMQQQKQEVNALLCDRSTSDCQNVCRTQLYDPFHQNLAQVYQQSQHSAYHQQMPQQATNQMQSSPSQQQQIHNNSGTYCNHCSHQLSATQVPGQGMTSPQDASVSQMRLMQRNSPIHQQNRGYPVNLLPAWPQNNGWIQPASQNQQQLQHLQPLQWQYLNGYHQTPGVQNISFNQKQNSGSQDQPNPQNHTNHPVKSTNQQPAMEAHDQQDGGRKTLQFTPNMIRDQELLVSTMRQQGVSDDVMRRQFDTLLSEQRRHLAYIAQFQQQRDDVPEMTDTRPARRRADEKPEWMVHITPTRVSYNEMQQRDLKKQDLRDGHSPEEMTKMAAQEPNYHQQKKEEMAGQAAPPPQMYLRMNPHQLANWPYDRFYTGRCLYGHQQNASNNVYHQLSPTFNLQYSYNTPYNHPYRSRAEQKIPSEKRNPNSSTPIDSARFYEQNKNLGEPGSLPKMRVYKEIIRAQKRNNGLQNPDAIQEALEALKDPAGRRGLEYLANLTKRKPAVRLNGVQESDEVPEDMQPRPVAEVVARSRKGIPANGLENTRNPNNPAPRVLRPKRADEAATMEYPRQRQRARICCSMQHAEKENGAMAQDAAPVAYDPPSAMLFQYGNAPPQHYRQMQQYYLNRQNLAGQSLGGQGDVASPPRSDAPTASRVDRAGGDTGEKSCAEEAAKRASGGGASQTIQGTNGHGQPDIRETRTIGGIAYLARKPEYGVNGHVVSPDKLIANRHLQPPRIF